MLEHEHHRQGDGDPEFRFCVFHKEHQFRLEAIEKGIAEVWKAINTMRNWVIGACGSVILALGMMIIEMLKPK